MKFMCGCAFVSQSPLPMCSSRNLSRTSIGSAVIAMCHHTFTGNGDTGGSSTRVHTLLTSALRPLWTINMLPLASSHCARIRTSVLHLYVTASATPFLSNKKRVQTIMGAIRTVGLSSLTSPEPASIRQIDMGMSVCRFDCSFKLPMRPHGNM